MTRFPCILGVLFMVLLVSCNKNDPAGDDSPVGTWSLTTENSQYILTTNSDQAILNPYTEGEGGIQITGAEEGTLTYLHVYEFIPGSPAIIINNNLLSGTYYSLMVFDRLGSASAVLSVVGLSFDQYVDYYGTVDYTFNGETLVITHGTMFDEDSNSVSIGGELTGVTVTIPANTPTPINTDLYTIGEIAETMTIDEDGTYTVNLQTPDGPFSNNGTWITSDDQIIFEVVTDDSTFQIVYEWSLDNDILKFWDEEHNACEDLIYDPYLETDCHESYEMSFGLEAGSLDSITTSVYKEYERVSDSTARINAGRTNRVLDPMSRSLLQRQQVIPRGWAPH